MLGTLKRVGGARGGGIRWSVYVAVQTDFTNYEKNIKRYFFKLVGVDDTFLCLFGSILGRNASDEGNEMLLQDILLT